LPFYPVKKIKRLFSFEILLLLPVFIFVVMMSIEIFRFFIFYFLIEFSVGSLIDHSQDRIISDQAYAAKDIREEIVKNSFGIIRAKDLEIEIQSLYDLNSEIQGSDDYYSIPVINCNIIFTEEFITPLPILFGLGRSFQHEYRHIFGEVLGGI